MNLDDSFYTIILDSLSDGVYFVDSQKKITFWNKGAEKITGYSKAEMDGRRCSDNLLIHINEEGLLLCNRGCPLGATLEDGTYHQVDAYFHHKDGHRVPVQMRVAPIRDSRGEVIGAVEVFIDNSAREEALKRIEQLEKDSLIDHLTGVANRRFLEMTLQNRHNEMRRYGRPFGIIFVDIDHFKSFNDRYGHEVGDKVLCMAANTLASNTRSFDVVGRWGGEEFVIILPNIEANVLASIANRYRLLVEKSHITHTTGPLGVTISLGATLTSSKDTIESVVKRADSLMYQSKAAGRNRVTT